MQGSSAAKAPTSLYVQFVRKGLSRIDRQLRFYLNDWASGKPIRGCRPEPDPGCGRLASVATLHLEAARFYQSTIPMRPH